MPTEDPAQGAVLVIDTNIVLDLFVFDDPAAAALRVQLQQRRWCWTATRAMREELGHVLAYPALARWLERLARDAGEVLAQFDAHARLVPDAPATPWRCADADDQKFIDLAVAHRAPLLSKDKAVLRMRRRLAPLGVPVAQRLDLLS